MAACLQVTLASDVYSFGVIMWCLYTGQRPFVVKAGEWLPNKQFPKFPPGTPAQYSALVQRCLQWDPHKRPTFPEVSAILTAFFNEVLGPGGPHASVGQVARTPLPMPAPTTLSVGGMQAGITGAPASSDSSAFTMVTDGSVAENWREDGMLAERFLASRSLTVASSLTPPLASPLPPASSSASSLPPASSSQSRPQPSGAFQDQQQEQSGSMLYLITSTPPASPPGVEGKAQGTCTTETPPGPGQLA